MVCLSPQGAGRRDGSRVVELTEGITLEHLAMAVRAEGLTASVERMGGNVWGLVVDVHGEHGQCVIVQVEQGMRASEYPCAVELSANFPPDPADPDASPFVGYAVAGPLAARFLGESIAAFARRLRSIPDALAS
jgi:hypothetical protein